MGLAQFLKRPQATDDKYSRGVVGFVTGSEQYPGAALLGVTAAMRTGAGLVRYLGPKSVADLVLASRPETVLQEGRADAWVAGSGVPVDATEQVERIRALAATQTLLVVDAGALEVIDFDTCAANCVLTPHAGEMAKLLTRLGHETSRQQVEADPLSAANLATKLTQQLVVLKGNQTVIAKADRVVQLAPAPTDLATAGTGDVLAGIIGAMLAANAQEINSGEVAMFDVVQAAIELQSLAAQRAAKDSTVVALDVAQAVGQIVAEQTR